ncbi:MAG: hypothetical protein ACRDKW_05345, partial [Actinomycetota bacterium]
MPLAGGSYPVGHLFPVGGSCCAALGRVIGTLSWTHTALATVTPGPDIHWFAEVPGVVVATPARASGWAKGTDRIPGCPGDSEESPLFSGFPDGAPCNDPLGMQAAPDCAGLDCEGNTGADDLRTTGTFGGIPGIPTVVGRRKSFDPGGYAPTLYGVGALSVIDATLGLPAGAANQDQSEAVESLRCPLIGNCFGAAAACILDTDCGPVGPCVGRTRRCDLSFAPVPCLGLGDFDGDLVCDPVDSCPTVPDLGADPDGDGVDEACDNCRDLPNPAWPVANSTANRHRTGGGVAGGVYRGQLDDDVDGRGNRCDMDYNQAQTVVG